MTGKPLAERVGAVSALEDVTRRGIWEFVARQGEPVGRDAIAAEFALPRSTAAFHLDRLAEGGLLDVEYRRLSGRSGPGAGRPAKLYRRAAAEISVSVPPRHYDLAGSVLADAVERSLRSGVPVADALAAAAHDAGRRLGAGASDLTEVLEHRGFEPRTEPDGTVVLANCPFHRMAADHPDTTCTLNFHLLRGAACACGADPDALQLDPGEGRCCVTFRQT